LETTLKEAKVAMLAAAHCRMSRLAPAGLGRAKAPVGNGAGSVWRRTRDRS
jgi:hypothetical protein